MNEWLYGVEKLSSFMLPEYKHNLHINTVSVAFVKVVLIASSIHLTNTVARMSAPLWLHSVFVSRTLFFVCV